MTKLSQAQIDAFHRDGYFAPVDVFTAEEARGWRADLETFERTLPPGPVSAGNQRKLHVRCPWARDLVGDPRLLDVMESLLGPDMLFREKQIMVTMGAPKAYVTPGAAVTSAELTSIPSRPVRGPIVTCNGTTRIANSSASAAGR